MTPRPGWGKSPDTGGIALGFEELEDVGGALCHLEHAARRLVAQGGLCALDQQQESSTCAWEVTIFGRTGTSENFGE